MKDIFTFYTNNTGFSLLAFEPIDVFECSEEECLEGLSNFLEKYNDDYRFGFLSYDTQETWLGAAQTFEKNILFPKVGFFVPQFVVQIDENDQCVYLKGQESAESKRFVQEFLAERVNKPQNEIQLTPRFSQEEYQSRILSIQDKMQKFGVEVVVFCQDFYAKNVEVEPVPTFFELNQKAKSPFSCFVKWEDQYLLSASPERFLKKEGSKLITQPIKGTARRGETAEEDEKLKSDLVSSLKEKEENSSVVKAIENEMLLFAVADSIKVEEFSEIYTFETVHQLISTISAEVSPKVDFAEIMNFLFPMGSMTGAPKFFAMQILRAYENFNRGLYSGTVGYFKPNGDFDFNVVIRSILYNDALGNISCPVGGGITLKSDPELEYYECLIKLKALQAVLNNG